MVDHLHAPFDVGIAMPTIVRPALAEAVLRERPSLVHAFPHLANVRLGDRVDVGAQATICRGMVSHTLVADDAKLGSLVYVSHGVVVGPRAWLSAGTQVAGHARIAAGALLGIGAVVVDNVALDDGVTVAAGGVVTRDAPPGTRLVGVPAAPVPDLRRFGPTPRG